MTFGGGGLGPPPEEEPPKPPMHPDGVTPIVTGNPFIDTLIDQATGNADPDTTFGGGGIGRPSEDTPRSWGDTIDRPGNNGIDDPRGYGPAYGGRDTPLDAPNPYGGYGQYDTPRVWGDTNAGSSPTPTEIPPFLGGLFDPWTSRADAAGTPNPVTRARETETAQYGRDQNATRTAVAQATHAAGTPTAQALAAATHAAASATADARREASGYATETAREANAQRTAVAQETKDARGAAATSTREALMEGTPTAQARQAATREAATATREAEATAGAQGTVTRQAIGTATKEALMEGTPTALANAAATHTAATATKAAEFDPDKAMKDAAALLKDAEALKQNQAKDDLGVPIGPDPGAALREEANYLIARARRARGLPTYTPISDPTATPTATGTATPAPGFWDRLTGHQSTPIAPDEDTGTMVAYGGLDPALAAATFGPPGAIPPAMAQTSPLRPAVQTQAGPLRSEVYQPSTAGGLTSQGILDAISQAFRKPQAQAAELPIAPTYGPDGTAPVTPAAEPVMAERALPTTRGPRAPAAPPPASSTPIAASVEQYRPIFEKYFGADADHAMQLATLESGGNATAHNTDGEDSRGLMQINVGPGGNTDMRGRDLFNPEENIRSAAEVRRRAGWGAWSTEALLQRGGQNAAMPGADGKANVAPSTPTTANPADLNAAVTERGQMDAAMPGAAASGPRGDIPRPKLTGNETIDNANWIAWMHQRDPNWVPPTPEPAKPPAAAPRVAREPAAPRVPASTPIAASASNTYRLSDGTVKTLDQMKAELRTARWGGDENDVQAVLNAYKRTTGKDVLPAEASGGGASASVSRWTPNVAKAIAGTGVPADVVLGVMHAVSQGLLNRGGGLLGAPATAFQEGENQHDGDTSIAAGVKVLADLFKQYGDWDSAISEYLKQAGLANVPEALKTVNQARNSYQTPAVPAAA